MELYPVFARLTIDATKEEVLELLKSQEARYVKSIVCEELSVNGVYHLHVLSLTPQVNTKNSKQNLRNLLKNKFEQLKSNARYQISKTYTSDYDKMGSYVVKDGNFCYYGFTATETALFVEQSYKKSSKTTCTSEINELIETFINDPEMSIHTYLEKYYEIRIKKYRRPISYLQAKTHTEFVLQIKYPEQINKTINTLLDDIGYSSRSYKSINSDDLDPLERKLEFQQKQLESFKQKIKKSKL